TLTDDVSLANNTTIPGGLTLTIESGKALTVTSGILTVETSAAFDGSGTVKTIGASTITFGDIAGFTVDTAGIGGSGIADALTSLTTDMAAFKNKDGIDLSTIFGAASTTGIGSVTLSDTNATVVKDNATYASGTEITLSTSTDLVTTPVTASSISGTNADLTAANFTLTIASNKLNITDSQYASSTAKVAVLGFTNVKLKSGTLISPALPTFNIGVTTSRS
ncbi:MAG: hypothetical protein LBD44_02175, partial [Spirochaetaceae bacterium]|nr:hypothetical protein [Spirochaetaceae bacterium]